MKKVLLSLVTVISFSLLSQAQFKVGIKAGSNLNDQRINVTEGSIYAGDNFKGYHAGFITEFKIGRNFFLQPQLLFSRKGATHISSLSGQDVKVRMSYVEFPVNVLYKLDLPFGKVFGGAGAAFSYAAGGKEVQAGITKRLYSGDVKDWKRADISLSFTAGLELHNGLFASINSDKGLMDIYKSARVSVKNKSFSVSLGYLIDWKKFKRKA